MSVPYIILSVILVILCVATVAMILMQKKREAGFGGSGMQNGNRQAYYDANKGRTLDGALERYTKVGFVIIMIVTILITIIS